MIDFGYAVGWVGVSFGIAVPIPQLLKIKRTGIVDGISVHTYIYLICALTCYLIHAIYISAEVFIVAQSVNLTINGIILKRLLRG